MEYLGSVHHLGLFLLDEHAGLPSFAPILLESEGVLQLVGAFGHDPGVHEVSNDLIHIAAVLQLAQKQQDLLQLFLQLNVIFLLGSGELSDKLLQVADNFFVDL